MILVVAMLVTRDRPAPDQPVSRLILVAAAIGVTAPLIGLYVSYWTNTASAALIVLVETGAFLVALLLGPRIRFRRVGSRFECPHLSS